MSRKCGNILDGDPTRRKETIHALTCAKKLGERVPGSAWKELVGKPEIGKCCVAAMSNAGKLLARMLAKEKLQDVLRELGAIRIEGISLILE